MGVAESHSQCTAIQSMHSHAERHRCRHSLAGRHQWEAAAGLPQEGAPASAAAAPKPEHPHRAVNTGGARLLHRHIRSPRDRGDELHAAAGGAAAAGPVVSARSVAAGSTRCGRIPTKDQSHYCKQPSQTPLHAMSCPESCCCCCRFCCCRRPLAAPTCPCRARSAAAGRQTQPSAGPPGSPCPAAGSARCCRSSRTGLLEVR